MVIGEGVYLGSPVGTYDRERANKGDFINHSCDPNVWMQDEVTSVARRDVRAGEELTMDYAMIREDDSLFCTLRLPLRLSAMPWQSHRERKSRPAAALLSF